MLKNYIKYLKDNPEGYWFKNKAYGWGYTPVTREGWITTFIFIGFNVYLALRMGEDASGKEVLFQFIIPMIASIVLLTIIAYKTGEKLRWNWGFPKNKDK